MGKQKAHFLHIRKTGGTAIKHALRAHVEDGPFSIVLHPHVTRLDHVSKGECVFFFLRDPITRFVSGFYSRQRQGMPRKHVPWTSGEADAFACFRTANELAEALDVCEEDRRHASQSAMREINHVRHSVWSWFRDPDYFASRLDDILFVGLQETLNRDFATLASILGLGADVRLPTSDLEAHRNPAGVDTSLSERARRNLLDHYSADIQFYNLMRETIETVWKNEQSAASDVSGSQRWNLRFRSVWATHSGTPGKQES
jgi:hypothetical protein